jgi:hypothetical protein
MRPIPPTLHATTQGRVFACDVLSEGRVKDAR